MKASIVTVAGVTLWEGARFTWINFGGIAWTGHGTIAGLDVDRGDLRLFAANFDRTPELEARRAELAAAIAAEPLSTKIAPLSLPGFPAPTPPSAHPYPFGDNSDRPLFFTGDAVSCAIRAGLFTIQEPAAPSASRRLPSAPRIGLAGLLALLLGVRPRYRWPLRFDGPTFTSSHACPPLRAYPFEERLWRTPLVWQ